MRSVSGSSCWGAGSRSSALGWTTRRARWTLDERAELERLRVENAELRMDREFLKKAAAFFVTENQNR